LTRIEPPLLGYNNNVRYLGRTFHIQTEDSGTKYARIMTHLFIDGGRIVKSTRTEYVAALGQPDMAETVRRMMKDQHKSMFIALRAGEFDTLISRVIGGELPTPAVEPALSHVPRLRADSLPSLSFGAGDEAKTMPGMSTLVLDSSSASAAPRPQTAKPATAEPARESTKQAVVATASKRPSVRPRKGKSSAPPSPVRTRLVDDPTPSNLPETKPRNAKGRPSERPSRTIAVKSSILAEEAIDPRNQSIFGESAAGRQTLDEVILSFLEDEET
jgi:hypothetical protein